MSAPNFSYQRRCVVVTNDDYEYGNYPELGKWNDGSRSYPSTEIKESEDEGLRLIKVVFTPGYYMDACIDAIDAESLTDVLGSAYYFRNHNRKELIDDVHYYFPYASTRLINKCFRGCKVTSEDYEYQLEKAFDILEEALRDEEEKIANGIINRIKKGYGFREYVCTARFSNGEAIYTDFDSLRKKAKNIKK